MKIDIRNKIRIQSVVIGIFALVLLFLAVDFYKVYLVGINRARVRKNVEIVLLQNKALLEQGIYSRVYYNRSIVGYMQFNDEIMQKHFKNYAHEIIEDDSVIFTMSLSKNCIISNIYPEKGHEKAIGLNLLLHPESRYYVEKSIYLQKPMMTGIMKMVEGGVGFVCYNPIYITDETTKKKSLWGMSDIVLKKEQLLAEAGIIDNKHFKYLLCYQNPSTGQHQTIWGDSSVHKGEPATVNVFVPGGLWKLSAIPVVGWNTLYYNSVNFTGLYIIALVIAVLTSILFFYYLMRIADENELHVMLSALKDPIFEMTTSGEFVKQLPTGTEYLVIPKEARTRGAKASEFVSKEELLATREAIKKCVETKQMQKVEYHFVREGKDIWYEVKINYLTPEIVLFVANNYTERKLNELTLAQTAEELRQINAQKDKFFSIIAHDLKNPILSLKDALDMLSKDFKDFSEEETHEFITMMYSSALNVSKLLLNLLEWSRSQTGRIPFNPDKHNIRDLIRNSLENTKSSATAKQIELVTNFEHTSQINIDANMIATVIRNLVSNSIKFTPQNGKIIVSTSEDQDNLYVIVEDTGVGMKPETAKKLFRIDSQITTHGTNGETGTGLGLILCKEFVDKHNGSIRVESEIGKGSKFIVSLPKQG